MPVPVSGLGILIRTNWPKSFELQTFQKDDPSTVYHVCVHVHTLHMCL